MTDTNVEKSITPDCSFRILCKELLGGRKGISTRPRISLHYIHIN